MKPFHKILKYYETFPQNFKVMKVFTKFLKKYFKSNWFDSARPQAY